MYKYTNTVLLGDKEQRDHYQQYNAGYVADLIQPGASPWGTDWLGEVKCPSAVAAHARPPRRPGQLPRRRHAPGRRTLLRVRLYRGAPALRHLRMREARPELLQPRDGPSGA